ncbi:PREDICTED: protein spotted leaf 11-like [Nelumbo nucifera]|uniref:Protein spotted leaf 11-like n=1 Tax=Nelumbo nucifera TaxID=4432 RepID=A0A1U8AMQ8_NELNU|nr:PREDICTED: protein spotted leaf 11-like [Nelumbo nucifera]
MEAGIPSNFTYLGRSFGDLSISNDSSSAFSDCNSDQSGEFPTTSTHSRRLLVACASEKSDSSTCLRSRIGLARPVQRQAAMELRLLAKNKQENRLKIARDGAVRPLISLISSSDAQLQENGVTPILNLSLCDENKDLIKPLVRALKTRTATVKENVAYALLSFSHEQWQKVPKSMNRQFLNSIADL